MNRCTAERLHTKEHGKLLRNIKLEEGEVPDSKAKGWEGEERKEGGVQEVEGINSGQRFHGAKRALGHCQKTDARKQRSHEQRRRRMRRSFSVVG